MICSALMLSTMQLSYATESGQSPIQIPNTKLEKVWNSLALRDRNLTRNERYKTSYSILKNTFQLSPKKVTIRYSKRWHKELDRMGGLFNNSEMGLLKKFNFNHPNVIRQNRNLVRLNQQTKSYSAPLSEFNGENLVLDPYIELAYKAEPGKYNMDQAWDLSSKPATLTEWIEGLTIRGEILWFVRKKILSAQLANLESANDESAKELRSKMQALGMDKELIDIKCKKVNDFSNLDENKEWCFYSVAPVS